MDSRKLMDRIGAAVGILLLTACALIATATCANGQDIQLRHFTEQVQCEEGTCMQDHLFVASTGEVGMVLRVGNEAAPEYDVVWTGRLTNDLEIPNAICFEVLEYAVDPPHPDLEAAAARSYGVIYCFEYDRETDTVEKLDVSNRYNPTPTGEILMDCGEDHSPPDPNVRGT